MILKTPKTNAIDAMTATTTTVVAAVEILHFRQQLVVLVESCALCVVPMAHVSVLVVAIRGLVTETAKLLVLALHETHKLTARATLQKELGSASWARDLRL